MNSQIDLFVGSHRRAVGFPSGRQSEGRRHRLKIACSPVGWFPYADDRFAAWVVRADGGGTREWLAASISKSSIIIR